MIVFLKKENKSTLKGQPVVHHVDKMIRFSSGVMIVNDVQCPVLLQHTADRAGIRGIDVYGDHCILTLFDEQHLLKGDLPVLGKKEENTFFMCS